MFLSRLRQRLIASDVAVACLPSGAARPAFRMLRQGGRDQVAAMIDNRGWTLFEPPMPAVFFRLACQAEGLIIDIGANTGFYALLAAAASKRAGIIAFEPEHHVLAILQRNVRLNRMDRRIHAVNIALSDHVGSATLYIPLQGHGLVETSSSLEQAFKPLHSEKLDVVTTTLDEFLSQLRFRKRHVSLIKVDVEGHEVPVLQGCRETVIRRRPILFVEVLRGADFDRLDAFIAGCDYVDVPLLPGEAARPVAAVKFHEATFNHAFVPREGLAAFLSLAKDADQVLIVPSNKQKFFGSFFQKRTASS
jgi:FkbM family methyltransferase